MAKTNSIKDLKATLAALRQGYVLTPDGVIHYRKQIAKGDTAVAEWLAQQEPDYKPGDRKWAIQTSLHGSSLNSNTKRKRDEAAVAAERMIARARAAVNPEWRYFPPAGDEHEKLRIALNNILAADPNGFEDEHSRKTWESLCRSSAIPVHYGEFRPVPRDEPAAAPTIDVTPIPAFLAYSEIVRLWAISLDAPPSKKGREAMETKMKRLAEFMHGRPWGSIRKAAELVEFDASPITTANLLAYRLHMIEMKDAGKLASKTIEDHVAMIRQLLKAAYNAGKLTTNPAADDRFVYYGERQSMRGGGVFSDTERRTIYRHLHDAPPVVKLMNLAGLWYGPRNAEVAELTTYDIEGASDEPARYPGDDGKPVLHIRLTHRPPEHRVKTEVTPRPLPLPDAWAAEAIAIRDALVAAHGHGPLFPEVPLDSDGRRNDNATNIVNKWLRYIGIEGKTFYAHRQTFKTLAREPVMAEQTSDAISGHASGKASRNYGYYEMWKMRAAIECATFNGVVA